MHGRRRAHAAGALRRYAGGCCTHAHERTDACCTCLLVQSCCCCRRVCRRSPLTLCGSGAWTGSLIDTYPSGCRPASIPAPRGLGWAAHFTAPSACSDCPTSAHASCASTMLAQQGPPALSVRAPRFRCASARRVRVLTRPPRRHAPRRAARACGAWHARLCPGVGAARSVPGAELLCYPTGWLLRAPPLPRAPWLVERT